MLSMLLLKPGITRVCAVKHTKQHAVIYPSIFNDDIVIHWWRQLIDDDVMVHLITSVRGVRRHSKCSDIDTEAIGVDRISIACLTTENESRFRRRNSHYRLIREIRVVLIIIILALFYCTAYTRMKVIESQTNCDRRSITKLFNSHRRVWIYYVFSDAIWQFECP